MELARNRLSSRSGLRSTLRLAAFGLSWLGALLGLAVAVTASGSGDRTMFYETVSRPLYHGAVFTQDDFMYSPIAARVFLIFTLLPLQTYLLLFGLVGCAAVAWLVAPLGPRWAPQAFLISLPVTLHGNLEWLMALVAVVGLRWTALWAIPLLTKITPGVGLLWFVGRREWRAFGIALGTTAALVAVSAALEPHLWYDWLAMLADNLAGPNGEGWSLLPIPLSIRTLAAGGLVLWGGRNGRPWTIVAAMMLSRPDLWLPELAMLVALPRLKDTGRPPEAGSVVAAGGEVDG
jgi:hypothetical protein